MRYSSIAVLLFIFATYGCNPQVSKIDQKSDASFEAIRFAKKELDSKPIKDVELVAISAYHGGAIFVEQLGSCYELFPKLKMYRIEDLFSSDSEWIYIDIPQDMADGAILSSNSTPYLSKRIEKHIAGNFSRYLKRDYSTIPINCGDKKGYYSTTKQIQIGKGGRLDVLYIFSNDNGFVKIEAYKINGKWHNFGSW